MTGKILRFDDVRGYGFIVPHEGAEDVFMHANDLLEEKYLYQAGCEVEFFLEEGDKGPKASEVRLVRRSSPPTPVRAAPPAETSRPQSPGPAEEAGGDGLCDVLQSAELRAELTEVLVDTDGSLTADQIKRIRARVLDLAKQHGWVEG
nr:cold shock domain-containing protein [Kutzneria buriramensis]WKX14155.1 cold shock domain-containing protein [Kutzneria buriramensis]